MRSTWMCNHWYGRLSAKWATEVRVRMHGTAVGIPQLQRLTEGEPVPVWIDDVNLSDSPSLIGRRHLDRDAIFYQRLVEGIYVVNKEVHDPSQHPSNRK